MHTDDAKNGQSPAPGESAMAQVVYVLYLISLLLGITAIVGLVIAYVYRDKAPVWLASHYHFQIRTFWIGFLYGVIGSVLMVLLIGWFVWIAVAIWFVVRCVKGLQLLQRGEEHPAPYSWWW